MKKQAVNRNASDAVGAFHLDELTPGKALLFPVVKMLSKTTEYPTVAREEMAGYGI